MAVHDHCEFRCLRLQVEFLKNVQHVDGYLTNLKDIRGRNFLRPIAVINVPAHGC